MVATKILCLAAISDAEAAIEGFAGEYNLEGRLRDDELISGSLVNEIRDVTPG